MDGSLCNVKLSSWDELIRVIKDNTTRYLSGLGATDRADIVRLPIETYAQNIESKTTEFTRDRKPLWGTPVGEFVPPVDFHACRQTYLGLARTLAGIDHTSRTSSDRKTSPTIYCYYYHDYYYYYYYHYYFDY